MYITGPNEKKTKQTQFWWHESIYYDKYTYKNDLSSVCKLMFGIKYNLAEFHRIKC